MTTQATPESIWKILSENAEQLKLLHRSQLLSKEENDRFFRDLHDREQRSKEENDRVILEMRESQRRSKEENDRFLRDLHDREQRSQEKTDRMILEMRESERRSKEEADRMIKKNDDRINELDRLFNSQWGKLIESLVEGDLVRILTQRGIRIMDTTTRLKGKRADGGNYEFDILAHDGDEVVVVEVKTTLRPDDIKKFLFKLNHFKTWMPRYGHNTIYGGMAWLTAAAGADTMLEKKGLFSIRATGNSASIVNDETFLPKAW
ncbi:MAG: hypothetical protein ACR2HF_05360 [Methylococcaceae bacterium]